MTRLAALLLWLLLVACLLGSRSAAGGGNLMLQSHRTSSPLLHESPYAAAGRPLTGEPLTAADWDEVYRAQRAFIVHVRMIVDRARERAGRERADG